MFYNYNHEFKQNVKQKKGWLRFYTLVTEDVKTAHFNTNQFDCNILYLENKYILMLIVLIWYYT